MNKISTWIAVALLVAAPLAAQITVISPNGGGSVEIGSTCRITWEATGISQGFKIILLRSGGGRFGTIVENLGSERRSYDWTVPETLSGDAPEGDYKIRVATMDSETHDDSNSAFAIAAGSGPEPEPEPEPEPARPMLRVLRPNGGETLAIGGMGDLVFDYKNMPAGVISAALYKGGIREANRVGTIGSYRVDAASATVRRGKMAWTYGRHKTGTAAAGRDCYLIRISTAGGDVFDFSDAPFSLFVPQDIMVTGPVSGETVVIGTPKTFIRWVSPNADSGEDIGATVSLTLVRESDRRETRIDTGVGNQHGSNAYIWSVRSSVFNEGEYRVRVDSSSGMTGVSGLFQLVREDDFVAEIVPGTMDLRCLSRVPFGTGNDLEYHFDIKARFRNGSVSGNEDKAGVEVEGWLYLQNDSGEWQKIAADVAQVTIPAFGGGWKTVTFTGCDCYGGVFIPRNQWKPLKFVTHIDRLKRFPDANRDNNTDEHTFTLQ